MVAIYLEEDSIARSVLNSFLTVLGYTPLHASNVDEFEHFVGIHGEQVKLVFASQTIASDLDLPLSRMIIKNPALNRVPLIVSASSWLPLALKNIRSRHTRIDDCLARPFGLNQLLASISRAHRRRASLRSSLLLIASDLSAVMTSAVFESAKEAHWKTVVSIQGTDDFQKQVELLAFRIGGIVVESSFVDEKMVLALRKFKRTELGSQTPILGMGQAVDQVERLRTICDLFIDPRESELQSVCNKAAVLFSKRQIFSWDAKRIVHGVRDSLRAGDLRRAKRISVQGLALDRNRWEFQEAAGAVARALGKNAEATAFFCDALLTNPSTPYSYLNLFELLNGKQRDALLITAGLYCPSHRQVQDAIKALKGPPLENQKVLPKC